LIACGKPNSGGPSGVVCACGAAAFGASVAGGALPNAPHIRLNLPVSESKTITRLLP
jgi:hypothetical protein